MTENQIKSQWSSQKDDWETPKDFFDSLDRFFHFTLDAAAAEHNAKCEKYFSEEDDGLEQDWAGNTVWLNPPYGRHIGKWVKKACEEGQKPNTLVVCLLPARTDTVWFHDYCLYSGTIRFIRGRIHFSNYKWRAPFPSMLVLFGHNASFEVMRE